MGQMQSADSSVVTGFLEAIAGLLTLPFDSFDATVSDADGNPTTIEYYTGGVGATLVMTLTLTYDASGNIKTAART